MDSTQPTEAKPSIPQRLEHIEELVSKAHNHADRMRPKPEAEEKNPESGGVEAILERVEHRLEYLSSRLSDIADTVGQL